MDGSSGEGHAFIIFLNLFCLGGVVLLFSLRLAPAFHWRLFWSIVIFSNGSQKEKKHSRVAELGMYVRGGCGDLVKQVCSEGSYGS